MNFKIVATAPKYPDIILYRHRDVAKGNEQVVIQTFGFIGLDEDQIAYEVIDFAETGTAKNFIRDFSKESGNEWCEGQNVTFKEPA